MRNRNIALSVHLSAALFFALIVGCAEKSVTDSDVVASWDDTAMTVADFKQKMIMRYRNEPTAEKKTLKERLDLLEEYVDRAIKLTEARRLGYDQRGTVKQAYDEAVELRMGDLLYNKMIRDRVITEDKLRDFYDHDKVEVRARHLLIKVPEDVAGDDTLPYWERIDEIYRKAKSGENFVNLVDKYSEDESIDRKYHGDLGYFKWGKMVDEFQEVAWNLKPGEISKPVRTRYGYHLIQLLDRRSTGYQVRTSHILVKVTRRAAPAETTAAWNRAMEILKLAKQKGADFAQLARRYSEDDRTWVNGDVGYIPRGSMPKEYWQKALQMKVGEVAGPVRTYKGYHIIKVTDSRDLIKPFDDPEVQNRLYSRLSHIYRDSLEVHRKAFIDSVKKVYRMEYNPQAVDMLLTKLDDKSAPKNMSPFSSLTREDRDMFLVHDKLGGMKVDELVEQYGDHRLPIEFRKEKAWLEEMVDPIRVPKYLSDVARSMGLDKDPEVVAAGRQAADNAMLPLVEQEMVFEKAKPTDEEIERYYNEHQDKYIEAATATVYEIMVDDPQFAADLMKRVENGENVSRLARRYSLRVQAKKKGGRLGPFTKNRYGDISRKAFELEKGEVAGPIKMGEMFSIIKLIDKTPERKKPLEEARRQIESDLRFKNQKKIKKAWMAELKKLYNLRINRDVVKRVWPLIEPLPEEMVAERDKWKEERRLIAAKARVREDENKIKLKLRPNTEQKFIRDGKEITVKIGQPRYVDKEGKEVKPSKSSVKLTPEGKLKSVTGRKIKLEPKPKDKR